jgi:uncharacterized protein
MVMDTPEGALITVWAKPRASKSRVLGRRIGPDGREAVEIALAAPPVEGAANQELREFLAKLLGTPASRLEFVSGETGRTKRIVVRGARAEEVVKALGV